MECGGKIFLIMEMTELIFKDSSTLLVWFYFDTNIPLLSGCLDYYITVFVGTLYKCVIDPKTLISDTKRNRSFGENISWDTYAFNGWYS